MALQKVTEIKYRHPAFVKDLPCDGGKTKWVVVCPICRNLAVAWEDLIGSDGIKCDHCGYENQFLITPSGVEQYENTECTNLFNGLSLKKLLESIVAALPIDYQLLYELSNPAENLRIALDIANLKKNVNVHFLRTINIGYKQEFENGHKEMLILDPDLVIKHHI